MTKNIMHVPSSFLLLLNTGHPYINKLELRKNMASMGNKYNPYQGHLPFNITHIKFSMLSIVLLG